MLLGAWKRDGRQLSSHTPTVVTTEHLTTRTLPHSRLPCYTHSLPHLSQPVTFLPCVASGCDRPYTPVITPADNSTYSDTFCGCSVDTNDARNAIN